MLAGFGLFFLCLNNPVNAQEKFDLINSGSLLQEGSKLDKDGKYKDAVTLYSKIPRSDTNYSTALYQLSYSNYLDSSFETSINYAKEGLHLFPAKATEWYALMGNTFDAMERRDEALKYYDSALALNQADYFTWFNKGITFYNLKRYTDAKACFQRTVLIYPYHTSSHYFLGVIAAAEGNIAGAMLSFTTNLLINPDNRYRDRAVNYLSSLSTVTDEINANVSKAIKTEDDNFELQQEIILSKAALNVKYKLQTDLDDPITRQLQVLLEKLEYNAGDKGFWMQYYVPFYIQEFKNGQFNTLVNYIFSGLDIKSVKAYNQKKDKEIAAFTSDATKYLNEIRRTEALNYADRKPDNYRYYFGTQTLMGTGKWKKSGEEDVLYGTWKFYYDNGQVKSEGNFNDNGEKEGDWIFYYDNGRTKEKSFFKNGVAEGKSISWFDNGNLSEEDFFKAGKLDGEIKTYYFNGILKSIGHYTDDIKNGEMKSWTFDGFLNYISNYKNDVLEGQVNFYYKNGQIQTAKKFANGKLNGAYKQYFENGALSMDGNYIDDKPTGNWKEFYNSKKIKIEYTYADGYMDGIYKQYYENGKLSETIQYANGKIEGKIENFDDDGIKFSESTYEKDRLKELLFFDKTGKTISSSTIRKGAANLTFFDANGNKLSEGYYNKDSYNDGKSTYYFKNGAIKMESNYSAGHLNGERKIYYSNGKLSEEVNFTSDKEDGFLNTYYINGENRYAGNFVEGEKQGEQKQFNTFGTTVSSLYYLNDEYNGYNVYYYANGKKDYEEQYRTGWLIKVTQFDTLGNTIAETNMPDGNGEMIFRHFNGKVYAKSAYRNYLRQGKYESFYFDGSASLVQYYKQGLKDSVAKQYFYGGKLQYEGKYLLGERDGQWNFYNTNGKLAYTESYEAGELNGTETMYNDDGTKDKELNYKNGMLEGITSIYSGNNELAVQFSYHNNELVSYTYEGKDGKLIKPVAVKNGTALVTAYYKNGNKSAEMNFEESMINGMRKLYFSNGSIYIEGARIYNNEQGIKKIYFANGKPDKEENYFYGNMHGLNKSFYANGNIKTEENWYNGEQNGISKYYDESGKLKETRLYYYDVLLSVAK